MSWYRTFLSRFNYFDANIPGNDFQFPVSVEGALGYNNAIQLTQPMHMQDLKYFRDPIVRVRQLAVVRRDVEVRRLHRQPGLAQLGQHLRAVHRPRGLERLSRSTAPTREVIANFAHYAECDVKGQLAKYDSNDNNLIEYNVGFLTGNDADTPTFHWAQYRGQPTRQDRAEAAFQWAGREGRRRGLRAARQRREGRRDGGARRRHPRARSSTILWDDSPGRSIRPPSSRQPATRTPGQAGFGNAIRLGNPEPNRYVDMPDGILNGLTDFTIGDLGQPGNGGQDWARIFDFGTGTDTSTCS